MSQDKTVLVVDDQDTIVHLVRTILYMEGYTVIFGCSGKDALHVMENHPNPIHLLLTDIRLGEDLNGCDLAQSIRALRPEMRVLYMSAFPNDERVAREVASGLAGFIPKPFSPLEMLSRVEESLSDYALPGLNRL